MKRKASTDASRAQAEEIVRREFVDLAFNRLRVDLPISPNKVEKAMRLIDSGAMDAFIERVVPAESPHPTVEMYVDVKTFSHTAWKKRHGVSE